MDGGRWTVDDRVFNRQDAKNAKDAKDLQKPSTVTFTLKCKYTPPSAQPAQQPQQAKPATAPANQVAQN